MDTLGDESLKVKQSLSVFYVFYDCPSLGIDEVQTICLVYNNITFYSQ